MENFAGEEMDIKIPKRSNESYINQFAEKLEIRKTESMGASFLGSKQGK
jgi:transcription initiation factor TFIIIB Brf1 subunit/transcription initiation factor TFIIB